MSKIYNYSYFKKLEGGNIMNAFGLYLYKLSLER